MQTAAVPPVFFFAPRFHHPPCRRTAQASARWRRPPSAPCPSSARSYPWSGEAVGSTGKTEYLILAKNTKGIAAADLVMRALEHPGLYTFSELLETPNIAQLKGSPQDNYYQLLLLFAYGSYQDYVANPSPFPPLSPTHLAKLRHLTIISLAADKKILPYSLLSTQLGIQNIRELEDLIIDAIYQKVIQGKLDQKKAALEVEFAIGRDLRPGQIDQMIQILQNWCQTSERFISAIDAKIELASKAIQENKKEKEAFEQEVEQMKTKIVKTPIPDFAAEGRKPSEFASAEYHEEDSRRGKSSRSKFSRHGPSGSRFPTAG